MVKRNNRGGVQRRPRRGQHSQPPARFRGKPATKANKRGKKKPVTLDQLDKEIEMYWGGEIGSKHLDLDMDDYWNSKPKTN